VAVVVAVAVAVAAGSAYERVAYEGKALRLWVAPTVTGAVAVVEVVAAGRAYE